MTMKPETPETQLDARLLEQIGQGDEDAFGLLYERFSSGLYSMALRIVGNETEAQDALQDAFTHIWKKAAAYDRTRSSPFTWAVMITRNRSIDRVRSRARVTRIVEKATEEFSHQLQADVESADAAEWREERARVRTALEKVTPDQREALELAFFSDLTHEEVAEKLNAPLGTVKARIRRVMIKLREILQGDEE